MLKSFLTSNIRDNDQSYATSFLTNVRFFVNRGRGHLMRFLANRIVWNAFPRLGITSKFPEHVDIELCSSCNMTCPMCFTTTDEYKENVKRTVMHMPLFKKIIDECAENNCFSVRLSWRGEPTLNPRFIEMARYAKGSGIKEVSSLTNLLLMTPEMFEDLVKMQMDWLTISFDGLGETYNKIRAPAKFEDAVAKIRTFHEIKKRYGSVKPVIKVQGVWPAIKEDPQVFYDTFEGIVDQIAFNPLLDYLRKDGEIIYRKNFTCPVPWQRLAVGADGLVSLCAHDEMNHHITGDIKTDSIKDLWLGEKMSELRRVQQAHEGPQKYEACATCFLPRESYEVREQIGTKTITIMPMKNRAETVGE